MINLATILCPIDLRSDSDGAMRYAIALARAYEAKLYVCYVVETEMVTEELESKLRERIAQAVLSHCYFTEEQEHRLPNWEPIITTGEAAASIVREAALVHADLIVMRSRHQFYASVLLGSAAESVCQNAPCPVLVTHPEDPEWVDRKTGAIHLNRILMAYDFSNDSELALSFALSLAEEYQSEFHLMHVVPMDDHSRLDEADAESLSEELQQSIPDEAALWCQLTTVIEQGKPHLRILEYADTCAADLICLGSRGAGLVDTALWGSTVEKVMRQASCPVLIARPLKQSSFVLAEQKMEAGPFFER